MAIPYFDAHCDTIWRCMVTEPVADYGETEAERRPVQRAEDKVGRNALCPCGSGKKYKKCCGQTA